MENLKSLFLLDPTITYLNFGSFGACPKPIFEDYIQWQYLLEKEPVQFIANDSLLYLQNSREALAKYIHCNADDIVLVTNPSYAVNTIVKSLNLNSGDEILTTNLEYGACDKTWNYYCRKLGAIYRRHIVNLPIEDTSNFIHHFFKEVNNKTKMIFISHITSSTGIIFPIKEICIEAKKRGILTFIDGAHAPGHIQLNLTELGADFYTGACHKWMMTPKGCAFMFVRKELQSKIDPLVVSWGFESDYPSHSPFLDSHQMNGTRDFSAMLTIPKALEFMNEYNWNEVRKTCNTMVIKNAPKFFELLGSIPIAPLNENFIGQMCSIKISIENPIEFQRLLYTKYKIEVPIMQQENNYFIRYSINAFNSQSDLDYLYDTLKYELFIRKNKTKKYIQD